MVLLEKNKAYDCGSAESRIFPKTIPSFPSEKRKIIRGVENLVPGKQYTEVQLITGSEFQFELVSIDNGWANVRTPGKSETERISLADSGVIPYEHGVWNPSNYIVRPSCHASLRINICAA